jgi:uncharacterized membrane protein YoaT (DUF817 family)
MSSHSKNVRSQLLYSFLIQVFTFTIQVASIVLLWRNNLHLLLAVLIEFFILVFFWHDQFDLSLFLIISVLGSFAEVVFVHFGVWTYSNPSSLGIPIWFPFAFGTSGLIGGRMARTIVNLFKRKDHQKPNN